MTHSVLAAGLTAPARTRTAARIKWRHTSIDSCGKGKLTNDGGLNHKVGVGTSASFNGGGKENQGETVTTAKAGSTGSWNLAPETVAKLTAFQ